MKQENTHDPDLSLGLSSAPQIDYFAFENKIRSLMHELMQPTVVRAAEDRQHVRAVQEQLELISKKQDDLEFVIHKTQRRATLFDEIFSKIANLQKEVKLSRSKEDQDIENIKTNLENLTGQMVRHKEEIRSFGKQNDSMSEEVLKFSELLAQDKAEIMRQMQSTNVGIEQINLELIRKIQLSNEESKKNKAEIKTLKDEISSVRSLLEMQNAEILRTQNKLDEVQHFKLDEVQFKRSIEKFPSQFDQLAYGVQDINSKLTSTENYIQKYLPIKIQAMLSDTLHASLGRRDRIHLADFEDKKFKEMHTVVLQDDGKPQLNKVEFHIPEIRRPSRTHSRASTLIGSDTDFVQRDNEIRSKGKKSSPMNQTEGSDGRLKSATKSGKSGKKGRRESITHKAIRNAMTRHLQEPMKQAQPDQEESPVRGKRLKSEAKKSYHESEIDFGFPSRSQKGQVQPRSPDGKSVASPRQEIKSNQGSSAKRRPQTGSERQGEIMFYEELKSDNETLPIHITEDRQSFSGSEDQKEIAIRLEDRRESDLYLSGSRPEIQASGGGRGSVESERSMARVMLASTNDGLHFSRESTQDMRIITDRADLRSREITPIIETRLIENPMSSQLSSEGNQIQEEEGSDISEISNESYVLRIGAYIKQKMLKYELRVLNKRITEGQIEVSGSVQERIKKLSEMVEDKTEAVTSVVASLQHDLSEESKRRKREKHDQNLDIAATAARLTGVERTLIEVSDTLQQIMEMIGALYEGACVDSSMTEQDQNDRQSMVLMGYRDNLSHMDHPLPKKPSHPRPEKQSNNIMQRSLPRLNSNSLMRKYSSPANVISLEQNSIKLAGQASNLVSAFKMACLAYNPSPVLYRGKSYDRISLLRARNKLLQEYWRRVQNMPLLQIQKPNLRRLFDEAVLASEHMSLSDAATGQSVPVESWVNQSFETQAAATTGKLGFNTATPTKNKKMAEQHNRNYILEKTNLLLNPKRTQLHQEIEFPSARGAQRFEDISAEVPRITTAGQQVMRIPAVGPSPAFDGQPAERSTHAHSHADKGRDSQWSSSAQHNSFLNSAAEQQNNAYVEKVQMQPKFFQPRKMGRREGKVPERE